MNETPASQPSHRLEWLVWSALVITVLVIAVAFAWTRFRESEIARPLDIIGEVPPFTLTNQFNHATSLSNLLGQVWVVDVIFTRCPVSCERMTQRMNALEKDLPARLPVQFISITADPHYDSPAVLKQYAEARRLNQGRWQFLTGLKRDVYGLSVNGLKFAVIDNENKTAPEDLFVHSTKFALVDRYGKIRGYFEGTEEEERKQLLLAVKKLAREK